MTNHQRKIVEVWNLFEELEPDISTPRLIQMVEDYTGADASEQMEALVEAGEMVRIQ